MNRKEITKWLGKLLEERINHRGSYYASEVSLDYGTTDVRRMDYLQFEPASVLSVSGIEKGIFTSYEIKSCRADFNSGFGKNFVAEKNYFVMPMETYKKVIQEIPHNIGVLVPVPLTADVHEEFDSPHELDREIQWGLKAIRNSIPKMRDRSMTELLFCMLRSGH